MTFKSVRLALSRHKTSSKKTLGADKSVMSRPLVLDIACYVSENSWLITGWSLLKEAADFSRHFPLPSPSPRFHRCSRSEICYAQGFADPHGEGTEAISLASHTVLDTSDRTVFTCRQQHHVIFCAAGQPRPATGMPEQQDAGSSTYEERW